MNILLINHYAGSPTHGMEYRPFYMAREWVRMGHQVTIVGASQSHLRSVQPDISGNLTEQNMEGIRYIWLKTPSYKGNGIGRVLNMLAFIIRLFKFGNTFAKAYKPDAVIASSTYPLDIYPARFIANKSKARLIYEVHDLWPLSPMELGGMSPWHPFIMVMQMAENYAYRHCDRVASMLPKAVEHMCEHGMSPNKFFYIPNGIDVNEWKHNIADLPEAYKKVFSELKEKQYFIVGYAGTHGIANALHTLLEAAELLLGKNIRFVFVGHGSEKEKLISYAKGMKLTNIIWLPSVSKESIPQLLQHFEICFIGAKKQPLYRFGISPNKLMDYMMAAKPIISNIEAGNDLVSESKCGLSVKAEDPQKLAEAIMEIYGMTSERQKVLGENGRRHVLKSHNYHQLAQNFINGILKK